MTLEEFLAKFPDATEEGDGWLATCPAHSDSNPSLRIAVGTNGGVLIKCRAACTQDQVLDALRMSWGDLFNIKVGDVEKRATSRDAEPSTEDTAQLALQLDAYADAMQHQVDPDAEAAETYAMTRFGLEPADVSRLGLGYAGDLGGGPRLVVPFRDPSGRTTGYQARALEKYAKVRWLGPPSPEGASWAKVAWFPGGTDWDEVLVCEGLGDPLTACALGYDSIGVRGAGLASNRAVVDQIAEWVDDRTAVVAGDGDPAGRTFSATLAQSLADKGIRVKILAVPDDEDLTSWRERDPAAFSREAVRSVSEAEEVSAADAALTARDIRTYPLTDLGNARFVRDYIRSRGSGVRYSPEVGFYLLQHGVWKVDKLDAVRAYVQEAAELVKSIALRLREGQGDSDAAKAQARLWFRWATYCQSSQGLSAASRELQALRDVATDVARFDQHAHLLACRNGVVDLRTGTLQPHDPDLLLTRQVQLDFDPDAEAPRWDRFLLEVFPDHPDLPAYIRRLEGYGITGCTDEQCFVVHYGTGANGKSVFTDTLSRVFEEHTETTPFSTFEDRSGGSGIPNDLAALDGARIVMANEGEQGRPMKEAVLKRVTGNDLISARFMRREFFTFRPKFLLQLASNYKPQIRGQDEGLWRRVKLVPWSRYFAPSERDHALGSKLLAEAQGILAWAVRGAVEWYASGLQDPPVIIEATKEYRETSNALDGFLPGDYVHDPDGKCLGAKVYQDYLKWADTQGLRGNNIWTQRALYAALEERECTKHRSAKGHMFHGLRLARAADREQDIEGSSLDDVA